MNRVYGARASKSKPARARSPVECSSALSGVHVLSMPIEPTAEDLRRLAASDDKGPFVLAQLLSFVEGGRDAYISYSREVQGILRGRGVQIVYGGECIEPLAVSSDESWDAIVLLRYPSRAAYLEMLEDDAFRRVSELRRKSLRDAAFFVMDDWPGR
jgi:hypothetical protein